MKNIIKKFTFCVITIFFIFAPVLAFSQTEEEKSGTEDVPIHLQIPLPFFGVSDSPDLSEYLTGIYRLLIGAGILFAIVMIIIAGYQWIFAGGSADKIGNAKKRIFSAVIGLILALLSYVILNAITPRLVAMRMPDIPSVKRLEFTQGETCQNSEYLIRKEAELGFSEGELPVIGEQATKDTIRKKAACGHKYYALEEPMKLGETPEQARADAFYDCIGEYCEDNWACLANKCVDAVIYGKITWPLFRNTYLDSIELMAVCADGSSESVQSRETTKLSFYKIPILTEFEEITGERKEDVTGGSDFFGEDFESERNYEAVVIEKCGSLDKFKGFVLKAEINDDEGAWYNILPTIDDDFALGKYPDGSGCMISPMHSGEEVDFDNINFTSYDKKYFFQLEDIENKIRCDINISDSWVLN